MENATQKKHGVKRLLKKDALKVLANAETTNASKSKSRSKKNPK
jgi:hypothetical protein